MILANSKFAIIPSCFTFNIYFFVNDASYLTPQKKFLEDLRF